MTSDYIWNTFDKGKSQQPLQYMKIEHTPEELAQKYVQDMKYYLKQKHKQHVRNKIERFARLYNKPIKMRYNATLHEPSLPTKDNLVEYIYLYKSNMDNWYIDMAYTVTPTISNDYNTFYSSW